MRFRNLKKQANKKNFQKKELPNIKYASYADRIKAFIVDLFMIYAPLLYIITYVFMDGKDDFQSSQVAPFMGVVVYGLIYSVLLTKFGQTPGKKAYEIETVDAKTYKRIGLSRAIWRYICFLFTATTLLGLLLPLYTKEKKALHDILSGTINRSL
ncbi:RDD family protein [Sulfurimonas sp. SAG-AH-194-I05]|nr:RDD family protein [Sulfurimonas sp. SAG-AH-194-I05]MDF1874167.1 RDD family protein [Sulfurimonas sp. SAG-AH-194-I05]